MGDAIGEEAVGEAIGLSGLGGEVGGGGLCVGGRRLAGDVGADGHRRAP